MEELSSYEHLVDIVTKRFFHGMDHFDLDLVMSCFNPNAVLIEMTPKAKKEGYFNLKHEGYDAIKKKFITLFEENSRIWHGNFVHTADSTQQSICTQFTIEVTSKASNKNLRANHASNIYLENGKFKRVVMYYQL